MREPILERENGEENGEKEEGKADGEREGREDAALVSFEDIKFSVVPDAASTASPEGVAIGGDVRATFLDRYVFDIPASDLSERVGAFRVSDGALLFYGIGESYARKRLDPLLADGFRRLRHLLYGKPAVYIHRASGIPLIGTNEFGLVDRGTNVIEVKPVTGCNFQCPYCSVDEGKNSKTHDYIVECEYLVEEAAKLSATKSHPVEFNIGPQGEPLLYPRLVELVRGLRAVRNCGVISVNTNGSLLTERLIDDLAAAGLTRINLSLNAVDQAAADRLSGRRYPLEKTLRLIEYCRGRVAVLLAPTIVPGFNDDQLEPLVRLSTSIKSDFPAIGVQNFLEYPKGRNPVKGRGFEEFFAMLKPLEEKYGVNLTRLSNEAFRIFRESEPRKPFCKHDVVRARVMMPGRYPDETVAVAQGRCITVVGDGASGIALNKDVRVRIVRDKHNIFKATLA